MGPRARLYCAEQRLSWEAPEIVSFSRQAARRWWQSLGRRLAPLLVLSLAVAGPVVPAGAQDPAPDVSLDDLLKLPSGVGYGVQDKRGGASRDEWQRRFQAARMDLREAKAALARSLEELDELGGSGNWKVTPPGLGQIMGQQNQNQQTGANAPAGQTGDAGAPLNYGLSGDIRRQKDEVKRAERALRDLEVEANLADVPAEWRR